MKRPVTIQIGNNPLRAALTAALLMACTSAFAGKLAPAELSFFESKIRPILVQSCYECHSEQSKKVKGGLKLDTKGALLKGGKSGPALVKGVPEKSLLIRSLQGHEKEMPPDQPLPPNVIADFVKWVQLGAPDPRDGASKPSGPKDKQAEYSHTDDSARWAFQPVRDFPAPRVRNRSWVRDSIDAFVMARLEHESVRVAGDASPRTLIRRLHQDLIGLPPELSEVESFEAAYRRDKTTSVARLVDDLLASPHFGERWGRHWLDVARYGESNGNDGLSRNPTFPHAWRYRDYVIDAFNRDTPYDQFVREQIAGDLLPSTSPAQRDRQLVATGLLALGAKPAKAMNSDFDMDVVADQIDVIGRGVMGISVACARCHDHKFDPIPTRDYYALAGIFTSTETMWGMAGYEALTAPTTDLHVLQAALKVPPPTGFKETVLVPESNTGVPKPQPKSKWPSGTPLAMGVRDAKKPGDTKININGSSGKLGEAVPRGFLTACGWDDTKKIQTTQSGRLELAQWLTNPDHPLTTRVMVNRVWMHLFGEGLVRTPDDFGVYGDRPTHPELLDHLAHRFVSNGWSVKQLIRSIVLSRTYQLASVVPEQAMKADPENRLLARHSRRRLDAESLRDAMLQASGQLELQPGEASIIRHRDILVNLAGNLHAPSNHRSVYLCYLRSSPPPELAAFDLPDFTAVNSRRETSTMPAQALHLFNNPFVLEQARALASRLITQTKGDSNRVKEAYRRVLKREPTSAELRAALSLVQSAANELSSDDQTWPVLCQALLMTDEFRYVD